MPFQSVNDSTTVEIAGSHTSPTTMIAGTVTISTTTSLSIVDSVRA